MQRNGSSCVSWHTRRSDCRNSDSELPVLLQYRFVGAGLSDQRGEPCCWSNDKRLDLSQLLGKGDADRLSGAFDHCGLDGPLLQMRNADSVLRVDRARSQEEQIGTEFSNLLDGISADYSLSLLKECSAEQHDFDLSMLHELERERRAIGDHGDPNSRGEGARDLHRCRTAVHEDGLPFFDERSSRSADRCFGDDSVLTPLLVGQCSGRASERAAMHANDPALFIEFLKIATDRIVRDIQAVAERGGDHLSLLTKEIEDPAVTLVFEHVADSIARRDAVFCVIMRYTAGVLPGDGMRVNCAAILFDMDGTLVDSTIVVERAWNWWAQRHGLEIHEVLRFAHGRPTEATFEHFLPGVDQTYELASMNEFEETEKDGICAVPGAQEVIRTAKEGRWAVVTSAHRTLAESRLQLAGLPVPEVLVPIDEIQKGKPDPEGFLSAARQLQVEPKDCLVFEDTRPGIEAGLSAGMQVVGLLTTLPEQALAHRPLVQDFRDIEVTRLENRFEVLVRSRG